MLYRFALGVGLLLLGAFVGRELSRGRPVRQALRAPRRAALIHPVTAPAPRKVSLH